MSRRVVSVELSLEVAAYLVNARRVDAASKDIREEIDRLAKAGAGLSRIGFAGILAGLPGIASAGAAGVGLLSASVLSGAAAFGALKLATVGVGDAMAAVADGDAVALDEAMSKLTVEAQAFVREYSRVRGALDQVGDATQSALFAQLAGDLEQLTGTYIPVLLRQAPLLAREIGAIGTDLTDWASAPDTVAKVSRQFELAVVLAGDLGRMLRAGTAILLDLADAGAQFTRDTVGGLADGTEALERWVSTARQTGQINQIFENGGRIIQELGAVLAEVGPLLADVVDNPALVDGAVALFDVFHIGITVVQALLNAFEALPGGVQSGIVTLAVFGGAALIVTGRVLALKASIDAMKVSAVQAGTAIKGVGAMLGGPWGIAIGAAIAAVTIFGMSQAEAKRQVNELASTIDKQTGAFTENTRATAAAHAEQEGWLKTFEELGVSSDVVVDAILGDAAAMDELNAAISRLNTSAKDPRWQIVPAIEDYRDKAKEATGESGRMATAIGGTTKEIKGQVSALEELNAALKRQTDPLFNLIEAQREVTDAQKAYNEAVKEHGKTSVEAKTASLDLAQAAIELKDAADKTAGTFGGQLTPELRAVLQTAGLTKQQINDVENSFRSAAAAADGFQGTYTANVAVTGIDGAISKAQRLLDLMRQLGSAAAAANFNSGAGYTTGRRWGGITEHAQDGLLRDAAIYSPVAAGARYAFAEPATGGEAFVPKYGDYGTSMEILSEAARWYGASVQPGGASGGGGNSTTINHNLYIQPKTATFNANDARDYQRWHAVVSLEGRDG